jgi:hypothetical protein
MKTYINPGPGLKSSLLGFNFPAEMNGKIPFSDYYSITGK